MGQWRVSGQEHSWGHVPCLGNDCAVVGQRVPKEKWRAFPEQRSRGRKRKDDQGETVGLEERESRRAEYALCATEDAMLR